MYDLEAEKIKRIKKDLKDNENLKRISMESESFNQVVNRNIGEDIERDIDLQIENDFSFVKEQANGKKTYAR